jgi:hypothetical protein
MIRPNPVFARPNESSIARDHLLNRILVDQLEGVTDNTIRLIVTNASHSCECRRKDSGSKEISMGLRMRKKPQSRKETGHRQWMECLFRRRSMDTSPGHQYTAVVADREVTALAGGLFSSDLRALRWRGCLRDSGTPAKRRDSQCFPPVVLRLP